MRRRERVMKAMVSLWTGIVAIIWIVPVVWAFFTYFKTETEIKTKRFGFLTKEWTF